MENAYVIVSAQAIPAVRMVKVSLNDISDEAWADVLIA
jgi:hypothetical protein